MVWALHHNPAAPAVVEANRQSHTANAPPQDAFYCARCDTRLAHAVDLMDVDGVTQHTRTNPHGNIFHFLSFRHVDQVAAVTAPSSDFTWFETLEWSIACCATCDAHVGWSFQRGPSVEFWGLLNTALQRRG